MKHKYTCIECDQSLKDLDEAKTHTVETQHWSLMARERAFIQAPYLRAAVAIFVTLLSGFFSMCDAAFKFFD